MRKVMLGMLLAAGAAVPTLAAAQPGTMQQEGRDHRGDDGPRERGDRPPQPRPDQPRPAPPAAPQPGPASQAQGQGRFEGRGDPGRWGGNGGMRADADARIGGGQRRFDDGNRPRPGYRPQGGPPVAPGSGGYRAQSGQPGYRPQGGPPIAPGSGGYRPQPGQPGYRPDGYGYGYGRGPEPAYRPGPGYQGQYRPGPGGGGNWTRSWRDDRRYDWHSYRVENRYVFNLPRYYAPRGWSYGYRRFSPGFTLSTVLFANDYWIDDPFAYRLPPAYGPYRWVRYYNDALLVDVRTGYVVDTVYDIFW